MRGVMGPQACSLLVLGVLLACGQLINGMGYQADGYSVRCTIGIQHTVRPPSGQYDVCPMVKAGFPPDIVGPKCKVINGNDQSYYTLYELAFILQPGDSGYPSREYIIGTYDIAAAESAGSGTVVPGTLRCFDIDECADRTNACSPNAACYNVWATYTCKCLDGYTDYSEGDRSGYRCDREYVKTSDRPELDIQIWVYVLIGVAIFVVLMLLICCCCCYSGSSGCCPSRARTKVIKHIKIVPQSMPVQALGPPPPCICKPPEEKKIIIQVDQGPQTAPDPVPQIMNVEPMVSGPSAFIANSGYDGKVYIAGPQAQPVPATRALPWADGCSMQTVNPSVQYIQQQPQVQYIQQPQSVQCDQPIYDQPIQTPYVYSLDVDPSTYYQ